MGRLAIEPPARQGARSPLSVASTMKQSTVIGRAMAKTLWPLTIHSSPSPSRRHATHAPTVVDCSYSHYSTMLFHLRVPLSLPFTLWLRLYPTPVPTCPPAHLALESTFIPLRCVFSIPPTSSGLTLSVHICVYSILPPSGVFAQYIRLSSLDSTQPLHFLRPPNHARNPQAGKVPYTTFTTVGSYI